VHEQLKSAALKAVLTDYVMPQLEVHAVYPTARHLPAKVRSFVDRLQQEFQALPMFNCIRSGLREPLSNAQQPERLESARALTRSRHRLEKITATGSDHPGMVSRVRTASEPSSTSSA
jgi:hypothetical protein